jgi:hypothetical protein
MSTEEKKNRLRGILDEIAGDKKAGPVDKTPPSISQKIKGGNHNTQISGNNNKVGK